VTVAGSPIYTRIYQIVAQIPPGRVATYGRIAAIVGNCTPRMVGYAMAALPAGSSVPWQRVVNAQGKISLRADSAGSNRQRMRLQEEGICFDEQGRIDLWRYGWDGPPVNWLLENGFDPTPSWT
jgi:methylated-DNA-protein-cysteine methyltransferase related protein